MQLFYRGQTFNFQATPAAPSPTSGSLTRNLFYRGQDYRFKTAGAQSTRLPRIVNWRYSLPCEVTKGVFTPAH
jgi:hypothetical protein